MNKVDFFSSIESHNRNLLPWVVYRRPNQTTVKALLQRTDVLHYASTFKESGFVFAPFKDAISNTVIIPLSDSEVQTYSTLLKQVDTEKKYISANETVFYSGIDKSKHINLISKAKDAICKGELEKVVLSRKQHITYNQNKSPLTIFKKLVKEYPTAFVYCWFHPKVGLWLGATPEGLLSMNRNNLKTMSLAGTQKYLGSLEVSWGAKEIEEQQLVTESIIKNLTPITKMLKTTPVQSHRAGSLIHLKTKIEATIEVDRTSLIQIINALHPTPAVCGLPKTVAKKFILENENYDRTYYTGYLGELNIPIERQRPTHKKNVENLAYRSLGRQSHLYVNLRCMQITKEGAQVYVGGGITGASKPEAEWEETVNKLQTMVRVLRVH